MAKVKMLNMAGAEVGEVTLNDEILIEQQKSQYRL